MAKSFKVKLIRSTIACTQTQIKTVQALGLRRLNAEKIIKDTPAARGQIMKVQHLLQVEVIK